MKKVILGVGMIFSGVIGIVGCFISRSIFSTNKVYWDIHGFLAGSGLTMPVILFSLLAIAGLIIGIVGAAQKEKK